MSRIIQKAAAANDNEAWSEEAYVRLIELSGKVLATVLKRLSGRRSIAGREIAEIIREVCRQAADRKGSCCPETLMIDRLARRLESDDRCV